MIPSLLHTTNRGDKLWYSLDTRLQRPKSALYFAFFTQEFYTTLDHAIWLDLMVILCKDYLAEVVYMAELAELDVEVLNNAAALIVKITGFHDKASVLAEEVLQIVLTNSVLYHDEQRMSRALEQLKEKYNNDILTSSKVCPRVLTSLVLSLMQPPRERMNKLNELLSKNSITDMIHQIDQFWKSALSSMHLETIVQGNICEEHALNTFNTISNLLEASISSSTAIKNWIAESLTLSLSDKQVILIQDSPTSKTEKNVGVLVYFLCDAYEHTWAIQWYLIEMMLTEPFFDELRTKQQVCTYICVYFIFFYSKNITLLLVGL
jgi:insulysin